MSTYDYGTYSTVDTGAAGALIGGMFIIMAIAVIIGLAIGILAIVGQWKAFKKAGKAGWEAIVPIYNMWTLCTIVGVWPWWVVIYFAGSIVLNIIPIIGSIASMALSIYFMILLYVSTARSYGKSDGFAAGLIFLSPIFWLILGGKNTQYVGARPMNDVVKNFIDSKTNNNSQNNNMNSGMQQPMNDMNPEMQQPMNGMNPGMQQPMNGMANPSMTQTQPSEKFCTNCGYKIVNGESFCPGCGNSIQ